MFLTDQQWKMIEPELRFERKGNRGRPRADIRAAFEAILYVLHTGIQWKYLPPCFPPKSTVHDYLERWSERQAFRRIMAKVVRSLLQHGRIDTEQCFVDATFAPAKGGGEGVGLTKKGKGTKTQIITDSKGVVLGVSINSANTGETAMVQETLNLFDDEVHPQRLIGDKAYDSDPLDDLLFDYGIEMISPHRKNRRADTKTQDGRSLRRYRHRWIVERTFAWLGNHRRLLVRHEKHLSIFFAFTLLGCLMISLRHLPFL
jgi:transposase